MLNPHSPISSIQKDQFDCGKASGIGRGDEGADAHTVLRRGFVDLDLQQQTLAVRRDMSLSSGHLLARIIASRSPLSVVFTLWLSTI